MEQFVSSGNFSGKKGIPSEVHIFFSFLSYGYEDFLK